MENEDRIKHTKMALRIVGIGLDDYTTDLFLNISDEVRLMGGLTTIDDCARIQSECQEREKQRQDVRKQGPSEDNQGRPEEWVVRSEGDSVQPAGV